MNNKTKIYDYACGVVNANEVIKFESWEPVFHFHTGGVRPSLVDECEYQLADATNEYFATDEGKADLLLMVQEKINLNDTKESLIDHVVKEFTKLINDGYTMEAK